MLIVNVTKKIAFEHNWSDSGIPSFTDINKIAHLMKWNVTDDVYGICQNCPNRYIPCQHDIGIVLNNIRKSYEYGYMTNLETKYSEIVKSIRLTVVSNENYHKQSRNHFPIWENNLCTICHK
jgi:hypothetical protein